MDIDYFKILVSIILALIGWVIAHKFTTRRDQNNKRRELVISNLIKAYEVLAHEVTERPSTDDRKEKLEKLISDIQLFGSEKQIKLVKEIALKFSTDEALELDPLINDLRNALRTELNLRPVVGNVCWLRFEREDEKQKNV